jgi:TRAP-type mannitol/chloroaromatic compound transport system substrate-binding protein
MRPGVDLLGLRGSASVSADRRLREGDAPGAEAGKALDMQSAVISVVALVVGVLIGIYLIPKTPMPDPPGPDIATETRGTGYAANPLGQPVAWRMASLLPRRLAPLGAGFGTRLSAATAGNITIDFREAVADVPVTDLFEAVADGDYDAAWLHPGYHAAREPALALFSGAPFGPGAGELLAWLDRGGGGRLMDEIYAGFGLKALPCGIAPPEGGGWFREKITGPDDLAGRTMRIHGLGARVVEKLGVETVSLAAPDIYPAFELGTIDAAEFSAPATDRELGLEEFARHYYFPGWQRQTGLLELLVSLETWSALSDPQRAAIELACGDNIRTGLAAGEARQAAALTELRDMGVETHRWPPALLERLREAWNEVADELAADDPTFAKVWESYTKFRAGYRDWDRLGYLD